MKKNVTFTKNIDLKTRIAEVTDIEVKHNLELNDNNELKGDIIISGKYKMTDASIIEEDFNYKLPSVIAIDPKYDITNMKVAIGNFDYEILNEESIKVIIDIELSDLEEVRNDAIQIPVETDELIEKLEYEEPIEQLDHEINKQNNTFQQETVENKNISSIISNITDDTETFSTYYVYIVREGDTIEKILDKYKISREELLEYNDLDNISLGTKIIVPCSND